MKMCLNISATRLLRVVDHPSSIALLPSPSPNRVSRPQGPLPRLNHVHRNGRVGVFQINDASSVVSRVEHHPFDRFYNFFSRIGLWSPWPTRSLWRSTCAEPTSPLYLLVDDSPHSAARKAEAWAGSATPSPPPEKRVATASGHNWVVVAAGRPIPLAPGIPPALPLWPGLAPARRRPVRPCGTGPADAGRGAGLVPRATILLWSATAAYACKRLLGTWTERVTSWGGLRRGDRALYDPRRAAPGAGRRGRKAKKGPRLPTAQERRRARRTASATARSPGRGDIEVTV